MLEFSGQLTTPDRFSYHTGTPGQITRFEADKWDRSWTAKMWMDKVVELVSAPPDKATSTRPRQFKGGNWPTTKLHVMSKITIFWTININLTFKGGRIGWVGYVWVYGKLQKYVWIKLDFDKYTLRTETYQTPDQVTRSEADRQYKSYSKVKRMYG